MFTTTNHETHIEANIVLQDGTVAGTGYGPSEVSAKYWACLDALDRAKDPAESEATSHRFIVAACGHSRELCAVREATVRREAAELGYGTEDVYCAPESA